MSVGRLPGPVKYRPPKHTEFVLGNGDVCQPPCLGRLILLLHKWYEPRDIIFQLQRSLCRLVGKRLLNALNTHNQTSVWAGFGWSAPPFPRAAISIRSYIHLHSIRERTLPAPFPRARKTGGLILGATVRDLPTSTRETITRLCSTYAVGLPRLACRCWEWKSHGQCQQGTMYMAGISVHCSEAYPAVGGRNHRTSGLHAGSQVVLFVRRHDYLMRTSCQLTK